jgi:predicted PurR-regulated permease PerM
MLFEKILLFVVVIVALYFLITPTIQLFKMLFTYLEQTVPNKPDPVKEAKKRLRVVEAEVEAAKINKKADQLVDELYSEVLKEDEKLRK